MLSQTKRTVPWFATAVDSYGKTMKTIMFLVVALALVGCKTHPDFTEVKLEDGTKGYQVNCKDLDEAACMADSTDVCKNGGKFLHRNVSNKPGTLLISCQ